MRKVLSMILSLALLITMMGTSQVGATATDSQEANKVISDANAFYYEAPDRSEYQLSQAQLDAPTNVLVDSILNYPYLVDLFSSNTSTIDAYHSLCESFNGFTELETRADAAAVLLSKFAAVATSPSEEDFTAAVCLQSLLSLPLYSMQLSENDVATYNQLSKACSFISDTSLEQFVANRSTDVDTYSSTSVAFTVNGFSYTRSSIDGSTTSGTTVPLYTALSDFDSNVKVSKAEDTAGAYGIDILGYATSMYNCHSYAWYHTSTSNVSWVADITPYINDAHCTASNVASVGSIAVYINSSNQLVHSAIVTSVNGDNVMCKSKWGANGLFEHHIANVPSGYRYSSTTVKIIFFNYSRSHSCTVTIDNTATHTKTCNICGWTATEAHVENVKTGKCITCGLAGPFAAYWASLPELPKDENTYLEE